jgi:hypothetical protein
VRHFLLSTCTLTHPSVHTTKIFSYVKYGFRAQFTWILQGTGR